LSFVSPHLHLISLFFLSLLFPISPPTPKCHTEAETEDAAAEAIEAVAEAITEVTEAVGVAGEAAIAVDFEEVTVVGRAGAVETEEVVVGAIVGDEVEDEVVLEVVNQEGESLCCGSFFMSFV
jgi:hypothetical protein